MNCPSCGIRLTEVRRCLVCEVATAVHAVSGDGSIGEDLGRPEQVLREFEDGSHGEWFECPACGGSIEGLGASGEAGPGPE